MRELGLKLLGSVPMQMFVVGISFVAVSLHLSGFAVLGSLVLHVLIAFITLRKGPYAGASLLALPLLGVVLLLASGWPWFPIILQAVSLFAIYVLAWMLHHGRSWHDVLMVLLVVGLVAIVVVYEVNPELRVFWQSTLTGIMKQSPGADAVSAEVQTNIVVLSQYLTGFVVMFELLQLLIMLMMARLWQSNLFMPGAFSSEFRAIRLNSWFMLVLLMPLVLSYMQSSLDVAINFSFLSTDIWMVLLLPLIIAGLSLVHTYVRYRSVGSRGLTLFYVLLCFLLPYSLFVLCAFATLDTLLDFRKRYQWSMDKK
jgi:hypothetical protein